MLPDFFFRSLSPVQQTTSGIGHRVKDAQKVWVRSDFSFKQEMEIDEQRPRGARLFPNFGRGKFEKF